MRKIIFFAFILILSYSNTWTYTPSLAPAVTATSMTTIPNFQISFVSPAGGFGRVYKTETSFILSYASQNVSTNIPTTGICATAGATNYILIGNTTNCVSLQYTCTATGVGPITAFTLSDVGTSAGTVCSNPPTANGMVLPVLNTGGVSLPTNFIN